MRRLESLRPTSSVKWATRPQVRGRLYIQHLVISAPLRELFLHAEVEREGEEGGDEPGDGEGGEGLVEAADHDAGGVVPGEGGAAVAEGPAEVPGEEGETEDPEGEEGEVGEEVVFGVEGSGEVEGCGC